MPDRRPGVRCRCGACEIRFVGSTSARLRIDCCCIDCRRAALWSANSGGTVCETIPCDLTYWANDLELVRGKGQLRATALDDVYRSVRLVCESCSSNLLVDHPAYKKKVCMAYREALFNVQEAGDSAAAADRRSSSCSLILRAGEPSAAADVAAASPSSCVLPATSFRGDVRDLPEELKALLPPPSSLPSCPTVDDDPASPTYQAGQDMAAGLFRAATKTPPTAEGTTLQRLLASIGPVVPLHVPFEVTGRLNEYVATLLAGPGGYGARLREKGLYDRLGLALRGADRDTCGAGRSWPVWKKEMVVDPAHPPQPDCGHTFVMATREFGPGLGSSRSKPFSQVSERRFVRPINAGLLEL